MAAAYRRAPVPVVRALARIASVLPEFAPHAGRAIAAACARVSAARCMSIMPLRTHRPTRVARHRIVSIVSACPRRPNR
ncbi:hypothetical protein WI71_18405 [Burkholderia diffusa]|nr:hypothetical protein WI71_18405 [Burkholderia diffusa]